MKEIINEKFSMTRGITLIALVVTIIILLILAGITISALTGNRIIFESKTSKESNRIYICKRTSRIKINGNNDRMC